MQMTRKHWSHVRIRYIERGLFTFHVAVLGMSPGRETFVLFIISCRLLGSFFLNGEENRIV